MLSKPSHHSFRTAFSWGWNNGQLGYTIHTNQTKIGLPKQVELKIHKKKTGFQNVKLLANGGSHTIIVTDENKMYSVGKNKFGQCGVGNFIDVPEFTQVISPYITKEDPIISLACGDQHSVFCTVSGKVYCFGKNFVGQLGLGLDKSNHSKPKHNDLLSSKILRVECGGRNSFFVDEEGDIWVCGYGKYGSCGLGDNTEQPFPKKILNCSETKMFKCIDIRAKDCFVMALTKEYEVFIWGGKKYEEEKNVKNNFNYPKKLCYNLQGRRVIDIAIGGEHGLILTSDGSVFGFGISLINLGYLSYIQQIKEMEDEEDIKSKLTETGRKILDAKLDVSEKFIFPSKIPGINLLKVHYFNEKTKIIQVECSETCNFALSEYGAVFSWGIGEKLELGLGKVTQQLRPVLLKFLKEKNMFISRIVGGDFHVSALIGSKKNFQNRHLDLGQKIPKRIQLLDELSKTKK